MTSVVTLSCAYVKEVVSSGSSESSGVSSASLKTKEEGAIMGSSA